MCGKYDVSCRSLRVAQRRNNLKYFAFHNHWIFTFDFLNYFQNSLKFFSRYIIQNWSFTLHSFIDIPTFFRRESHSEMINENLTRHAEDNNPISANLKQTLKRNNWKKKAERARKLQERRKKSPQPQTQLNVSLSCMWRSMLLELHGYFVALRTDRGFSRNLCETFKH